MTVSVIIPVFNDVKDLERCIESLGAQTFPSFEIIVVDDGSTDNTFEILRNLKKTLPNFRFEKQSHLGAGAARNLGAKQAKGEILAFLDADMTFENNFLEKLVDPILSHGAKGTFSKEEYVGNWENIWAREWNLNEGWENGRRHPRNYPDHQPVFRAILKAEFDRVGGFTSGGYNDDWSLSKKLGYEAISAPNAVFYHRNPSSIREIFFHAKWIGKRDYKLGPMGGLVALVRSSLPVSILIGLYKSVISGDFKFVFFKIVFDFGVFLGILEYIFTKKGAK